jgi:N-carbamoylputrescine amidase
MGSEFWVLSFKIQDMRDIRVAAAVTRCPVGCVHQNFQGMIKWIKAAKKQGAEVICFPEMNITGYLNHPEIRKTAAPIPGAIGRDLVALASDENITLLAGMAEAAGNGVLYASHVVANPDGSMGVYRKVHIAPTEKKVFHPGTEIPLFELGGVKFGIQLCYDAHFPELSSYMAINGADIIFIPHASPRTTPTEKFKSWSRHLPARAFDNGLFVVACNQTGDNEKGLSFPGIAMVIGPSGEIIKKKITGKEGILVVDLKAADLAKIRTHEMRYFLPNRRPDQYWRKPAESKEPGV